MRSSYLRPYRAVERWYEKAAAFNVESVFSRKRPSAPRRTIFVNENLPVEYLDPKGRVLKDYVYDTNQVITSKYTVLTFAPRNILEQFRRVANVFFLVIAILQFSNKFSTINPGLVILPLVIVLAITAAKDGYEDIKRHHADRQVNHSMVRVISGGNWVNANAMTPKSKTFVRGIVPKSAKRGHVKSKAIGTETKESSHAEVEYDDSDVQGAVQGAQQGHHQDGAHSNRPHWVKKRWEDVAVGDFVKIVENEPIPADILICTTSEDENVAYIETKSLDGETNLKSRHGLAALSYIRNASSSVGPHNTLRIECDKPNTNLYKLSGAVHKGAEVFPVDMSMVLLRGTVLRNTGWAIGIVLFTGEDTRIVMNAGNTPSKRSKVERQMDPLVLLNLLLLALMATACGIADSVLEHRYFPRNALWLWGDDRDGDRPSVNGLITFCFALITFQNIVPISLYISIEFVRTVQAAFIYYDTEMYCPRTNQPTIARSWNLSDDLGQIEYIFSDKTGTLTQNVMFFRQCTIGGKIYNGANEGKTGKEGKELPPAYKETDTVINTPSRAPVPVGGYSSHSRTDSGSTAVPHSSPDFRGAHLDLLGVEAEQAGRRFYDADLARELVEAANVEPGSPEAAHARRLNAFLTILALCHTVIASVNPETHEIAYKAQSPDESALVQAAADMGYVFRGRDHEVLTLQKSFSVNQYGGEMVEKYELLQILEFSSARKRMSVIVRQLDDMGEGKIFLLTKGADNVIFERLKMNPTPEADMLRQTTERHLDQFASQGLRTLTLAYRYIEEEEYEAWSEKYHAASVAVDDREEEMDNVASEIEQQLRLVGATAIEDKLQDGVPEAIADLKKAGIKVWVATGDKLETAIAIGHSTNLITDESNLIVIRGGSENVARPTWSQLVHAAQAFFPDSGIVDEHGKLVDDTLYTPPSSAASHGPATSYGFGTNRARLPSGRSSIVGHDNGNRPGGFILVIDGNALEVALADEQHKILLLRLATHCEGVICCRVSPLQKALVVNLVKNGLGVMTLAIGDGANDVSMIQAADVGVGISGEEGLQAVNSADYAIAQFRFLKRLLLVHGHWSYARNSNMILNFFYKNIVCIGVLWWFQIYNGWSAQYVFEYTYLLFWNAFWTIAPVIGIGLFDRIVDDKALMALPELYRHGRVGSWFGMKRFLLFMFDGIVQSAIIFFLIWYSYFTPSARDDGYSVSLYEVSTVMVFGAVFAANLYNGLNTSAWTAWVFFCVFIGDVLVWVYTAVYDAIRPASIRTPVYGNNHFLFQSAYYWCSFPLVVILALAPRYLIKAYRLVYFPSDFDVIRNVLKQDPNFDLSKFSSTPTAPSEPAHRPHYNLSRTTSLASQNRPTDAPMGSRMDMSNGARSVDRGFGFSMEENGVALRRLQSNLSERQASHRNTNASQSEAPHRKRNSVLAAGKSILRKSQRKKPQSREGA